jgi:excisionase family DNA binding protein
MAVFCKLVMSLNQAVEISENTSQLLTRVQAAAYLNQTVRWMYRAPEHGIPFVKLGRAVRFKITDLDNFISRNRVGGEMR